MLACETLAAGMVGTVDLRVAVHTAAHGDLGAARVGRDRRVTRNRIGNIQRYGWEKRRAGAQLWPQATGQVGIGLGAAREIVPAVDGTWMRRAVAVTFLAQPGLAALQQREVSGTVRRVAVHAVVHRAGVLVQERAAFLGVAGEACVANAFFLRQLRPDRTVRVVAVGTRNFALGDRMGRDAVRLRAYGLVARKADFALGCFAQHLVA